MRGCTGDNGEHTNDAEKCSIEAGAYLLKYLAIPPWRGILPQRSNCPSADAGGTFTGQETRGFAKTKQTQGKVGHNGPVRTNQSAEVSSPNQMPLPALLIGTEFPLVHAIPGERMRVKTRAELRKLKFMINDRVNQHCGA